MKKQAIISIVIVAILFIIPMVTYAAGLTRPFGGRVVLTTLPIVTCTGSGTGPVILIRMNGVPYYTESSQKTPKVNDWIFRKCQCNTELHYLFNSNWSIQNSFSRQNYQ